MPRSGISLFRRIERALETIALGSTPLRTIHTTAGFLAVNQKLREERVVVKRRAPESEEIPA
jgi:hypothetical protein